MFVQLFTPYPRWKCPFTPVAFDTIRRYFEYRGYEVVPTFLQLYRCADDKIINRAMKKALALRKWQTNTLRPFKDAMALGLQLVTSRVVEFMDDIIRFVTDLIERLCATESQGCLLKKSHNYAKIS